MRPDEVNELRSALVQGWNIAPRAGESLTPADLLEQLTRKVSFMLRHNFERLQAAMYLLDVPEKRFNAALSAPSHEAAARRLAEAILDREREKMETRRAYRREKSIDVSSEGTD